MKKTLCFGLVFLLVLFSFVVQCEELEEPSVPEIFLRGMFFGMSWDKAVEMFEEQGTDEFKLVPAAIGEGWPYGEIRFDVTINGFLLGGIARFDLEDRLKELKYFPHYEDSRKEGAGVLAQHIYPILKPTLVTAAERSGARVVVESEGLHTTMIASDFVWELSQEVLFIRPSVPPIEEDIGMLFSKGGFLGALPLGIRSEDAAIIAQDLQAVWRDEVSGPNRDLVYRMTLPSGNPCNLTLNYERSRLLYNIELTFHYPTQVQAREAFTKAVAVLDKQYSRSRFFSYLTSNEDHYSRKYEVYGFTLIISVSSGNEIIVEYTDDI